MAAAGSWHSARPTVDHNVAAPARSIDDDDAAAGKSPVPDDEVHIQESHVLETTAGHNMVDEKMKLHVDTPVPTQGIVDEVIVDEELQ